MRRFALLIAYLAAVCLVGPTEASEGKGPGLLSPETRQATCIGDLCGGSMGAMAETTEIPRAHDRRRWYAAQTAEADRPASKCRSDLCQALARAADAAIRGGTRGIKTLGDPAEVIAHHTRVLANGGGDELSEAERRLRESKVVDALWHMTIDSQKRSGQEAAGAAEEVDVLAKVNRVAASAYRGPGGAAAYAAWLGQTETGDPELALRVGVMVGITKAALDAFDGKESEATGQSLRRRVLAGAIGGAAVAAAGGDEHAVWHGFLRSGGLILVSDGYTRISRQLRREEAPVAAVGEAFCMSMVGAACAAPSGAYVLAAQGGAAQDGDGTAGVAAAQPEAGRTDGGQGSAAEPASWVQDTSGTETSRVPGMNALTAFRDQWTISWDRRSLIAARNTAPAVVLTYTGLGAPAFDLIPRPATSSPAGGPAAVASGVPRQIDGDGKIIEGVRVKGYDVLKTGVGSASFLCSESERVRRIVLEAPSLDPEFACRVYDVSGQRVSVPWRARSQTDYCRPKAAELVAQRMAAGWSCFGQ